MSGNSEITIPSPSVASVAAGVHEDHEIVTVAGTALDRKYQLTNQDNPWATFTLTNGRAGIEVRVCPRPFQELAETIAEIPDPANPYDDLEGPPEPGPTLTVTGHVGYRAAMPRLTATSVHIKP